MSDRLLKVEVGKTYRNIKHGTFYTVLGFTRHSETHELLVTYDRVEEHERSLIPWSRPISLFRIKFEEAKYTLIEPALGSTIEQVVNELLNYKRSGSLAYCNFNGVTLYSDTVTMDDAYMKITGMNKAEFAQVTKRVLNNDI